MKESAIGGRVLCSILDDMRNCHKTHNYSYMEALIEELQYRANRMEDRLDRYCGEWGGIENLEKRRDGLKADIAKLKKEKPGTSDE